MNSKLRAAVIALLALALSACVTTTVADKAARFSQASAAYDAGDFTTAYQIWSELADEDDLAAMRNAAQLLRQGKGVAKDSEKAFDLYNEAAEKGLVTAMANVAEMYYAGEGTEKDVKAAIAWYSRAAGAGLSLAQLKLAEFYEQGIGVPADPARARALVERAAHNGYAPARAKLAAMGGGVVSNPPIPNDGEQVKPLSPGDPINIDAASAMPPEDLAAITTGLTAYAAGDRLTAFDAWRGPAERGNAEAQLKVGLMYERGDGRGQDMIEAYRWLKLSAAQGNKRASAEFAAVAKAMSPSDRVIAESLAKSAPNKANNTP